MFTIYLVIFNVHNIFRHLLMYTLYFRKWITTINRACFVNAQTVGYENLARGVPTVLAVRMHKYSPGQLIMLWYPISTVIFAYLRWCFMVSSSLSCAVISFFLCLVCLYFVFFLQICHLLLFSLLSCSSLYSVQHNPSTV